MLNFDLRVETYGESVVIHFDGDIDIMVARQVREALDRIEASTPARLVIDLSRTTFLDSAGMALIAAAHGRAQEDGRRMVVVRPRLSIPTAAMVNFTRPLEIQRRPVRRWRR